MPLPDATGTGFLIGVAQDHNGARVRGYDFTDQLQQESLQHFEITDGINRVGDLEKGIQVAGHPPDIGARMRRRGIGAYVGRGQQVDSIVLLEVYRLASRLIVFRDQEHQFTPADANRIAVRQKFTPHRNAIYECAIMTFQVDELERGIGPADREVPPRNRAITQAKMVGRIPANRELVASKPYHRSLRRSRNHHYSRVQVRPQGS